MLEYLIEWVRSIMILVIVISIMEIIMPNGNISKFFKYICGLIIISAIISPLSSLL